MHEGYYSRSYNLGDEKETTTLDCNHRHYLGSEKKCGFSKKIKKLWVMSHKNHSKFRDIKFSVSHYPRCRIRYI